MKIHMCFCTFYYLFTTKHVHIIAGFAMRDVVFQIFFKIVPTFLDSYLL